jgi:ferritin-like metal-binding protein YciE
MATRSAGSRTSKTGGTRRARTGSSARSSASAKASRSGKSRSGGSRATASRGRSSRRSSEELGSLQQLFLDNLADVYSAEKQILGALPKMARAASAPELREAFETHLEETRAQVERLDQVVQGMGQRLPNKKCKGMEGLIEEGREVLEAEGEPSVRDAGLIAAAQKIEHYEMASYGSLRAFAEELGIDEAPALLQQTLDEEGRTDHLLTQLAESLVNGQAHRADASMS